MVDLMQVFVSFLIELSLWKVCAKPKAQGARRATVAAPFAFATLSRDTLKLKLRLGASQPIWLQLMNLQKSAGV